MTKVIISCDEYIYSYNNSYYLREFGQVLFNRYLEVFDELRIVLRTKKVNKKEDLGIFNLLLDNNRIEVVELPFFQGPIQYASNYFAIRKVLKGISSSCDLGLFRLPSTVGFACLREISGKISFGVEIVANPLELYINSNNLLHKILFKIMHTNQVRACRNALGASYVTKNALQKIYPNPNINSYYSSIELPDSFFQNRTVLKNDKFVICHSSLHINSDSKGHTTVIKVIKSLRDKGYNVECIFSGDGIYVNKYKELANSLGILENVKFYGLLNQQQLLEFYKGADIMLFPSSSEGLPRVIIEALATGLPCLATPVGGIPELLDNEFLFEKDDIEGFTSKIIQLIENYEYYKLTSLKVFNTSKEYSKTRLSDKRITFFKKLKENIL